MASVDVSVVKRLVAFFLLLSQPASALQSGNSSATVPTQLAPVSTPAAASASLYLPRNCDTYPPKGKASPDTDSATLFSFRLTADGTIRGVGLVKSSGDDNRDKAVLACAADKQIEPLKVDGKPAEVRWEMGYFWRPQLSGFSPIDPAGTPVSCKERFYPPRPVKVSAEGTTIVSYHIAIDGNVKDAIVTQSSGSAILDQASMDCVSTWRYVPAMQNGQPVQVDKTLKMSWQMRR